VPGKIATVGAITGSTLMAPSLAGSHTNPANLPQLPKILIPRVARLGSSRGVAMSRLAFAASQAETCDGSIIFFF
jgi:hypothetical protein